MRKLVLSEPFEYAYGESKGHSEPNHQKTTMWYVYILRCADGMLYTGSTTDIDRRVKEHNRQKGGAFTRVRLPVKLVYQQSYPSRTQAQKREAQIKSWTRKKKLALIKGNLSF